MAWPSARAASPATQRSYQRADWPLSPYDLVHSLHMAHMSDLARLPSYPSPTTLIARSGIQFLDFGFDPDAPARARMGLP